MGLFWTESRDSTGRKEVSFGYCNRDMFGTTDDILWSMGAGREPEILIT